jgi:2-isopropylmalate synthase
VLDALKKKELEGYSYEGAEASFNLMVEKALGRYRPAFDLLEFRVAVEKTQEARHADGVTTEATVKLKVNGRPDHTVGEGDGPVNALDNALRKSLEKFYPSLKEMTLTDYKVRVVNATAGTAAKVRVLIESRDAKDEWITTGVSTNLIEASWLALVDAVEYKIFKTSKRSRKPTKH